MLSGGSNIDAPLKSADKLLQQSPEWTLERVERLTSLWAAQYSAAEISEALGVSRNAVLGKLHRLKAPNAPPSAKAFLKWTDEECAELRAMWASDRPTSSIAKHFEVTPMSIYKKAYSLGLPNRKRGVKQPSDRRKSAPRGPRIVPIIDSEIPLAQRCTLMDLKRDSCRWPIGDPGTPGFFFCGGSAKQGKPYCPYHDRVAHSSVVYTHKPFVPFKRGRT